VEGIKVTARLAPSMHTIVVDVADSKGNTARDQLLISIE
jgi:hypothetical protein